MLGFPCQANRESDRLHNIYSQDLEEMVVALIDALAKLNRAYLTPLEEKLLAILED
jgi:hypothetical protein